MKFQFSKTYAAPGGLTFEPGWVAELSEPDAQRLADEGFGQIVHPETRCRRSGLFLECVPTGESMTLEQLQEQSINEAREVFTVLKNK